MEMKSLHLQTSFSAALYLETQIPHCDTISMPIATSNADGSISSLDSLYKHYKHYAKNG
jgi:hypothetical protein